jgi:transposase, IS5 family
MVPDRSTLSRFRSELTEKSAMHRLLTQLNAHLVHQGVLVQQGGGIIDAPITPTDRKPHGKTTYMLPEYPNTPPTKKEKPGVDREARWVKKGNKLQHGYKRHYLAAEDTGLVLAVHPTAVRVHDGQCRASCLDQVRLPAGSRLLADTGYGSAKNDLL